MGFTGQKMIAAVGAGRTTALGTLSAPPLLSLVVGDTVGNSVGRALFSALSLALAMFAKSIKEGQYYLTPLLMVTLGSHRLLHEPPASN